MKRIIAFTFAEGATHVSISDNIGRVAFTLAEVLITLGIIGIVAALTIPTLVHNYKKKIIETKLVKFYSTVNNAVELAEIDHGDAAYWDMSNGKWFIDYVQPYMKIAKTGTSATGKPQIYFMDGSMLYLPGIIDMYYYIDGNKINTSKLGRELFMFQFYPDNTNPNATQLKDKKFAPYLFGWDGKDKERLKTNCSGTTTGGIGAGAYCTALIWLNNWKIPDDYPIKF